MALNLVTVSTMCNSAFPSNHIGSIDNSSPNIRSPSSLVIATSNRTGGGAKC